VCVYTVYIQETASSAAAGLGGGVGHGSRELPVDRGGLGVEEVKSPRGAGGVEGPAAVVVHHHRHLAVTRLELLHL